VMVLMGLAPLLVLVAAQATSTTTVVGLVMMS
jgi:hypothetical protein